MKVMKIAAMIFVLVSSVLFQVAVLASDKETDKEKEMNEIVRMELNELTLRAKAVLDKKYPGEDWGKYQFPKYIYIHDAVQTAYKIAVKNPQLLAKIACACFCDEMGHKNLAYCFLKNGAAGGDFDEHGSNCNICVIQAMRAFLWDEMGATEAEIKKKMKELHGR